MRELPKGFEAKLRFIYKYDTSMELGFIESFTNDVGIQNEEDFVGTIVKLISEREDPKEFEYWINKIDEVYSVMQERYLKAYPLYLVALQQMDELREMAKESNLTGDILDRFESSLSKDKKDIIEKIKKNDILFIEAVSLRSLERRILEGIDFINLKGRGKIYETDPKLISGVIKERISQRTATIKANLNIESVVDQTKEENVNDDSQQMIIILVCTIIIGIILFLVVLNM